MSWSGYWELDGTEIANGARTEAYVKNAGFGWLREVYDHPEFHEFLGQAAYVDPVTDQAPWYDPDEPLSAQFYGFYPLDVEGADSSSRSSTVTEFTIDGGNSGRVRHGTKAVVFNGVLLGANERAVEYGNRWLRRALLGAVCSDRLATETSLGSDLGYFGARPEKDNDPTTAPSVQSLNLMRVLRKFTVNNGPTVLTRRAFKTCGGAMAQVTFTGVAGSPYEFGMPRPIIQGYNSAGVTNPFVPGVTPGYYDAAPTPFAEVACGVDTWAPIYDPLCPALIAPPTPPAIPLQCFTAPANWDRRKIEIPPDNVPLWGDVVPVVTLHAPGIEVRNARLRFYEDPEGIVDPNGAPCSFTGDVVVSWIPANGSLIFDAASEHVYVETALGHRRRADSLVFQTDGTPFEWPNLSCGYGYVLTLDTPVGSTAPVLDVTLIPKAV